MSAPTSDPESSKNEASHSVDTASLGNKERGSDDTEGSSDLSQDLDQESEPEYATSFRLIIIMSTLSLSTLIAALDLVSIIQTQKIPPFMHGTRLTRSIRSTGYRCHGYPEDHQ